MPYDFRWAKVGLVISPSNPRHAYVRETLGHAGIVVTELAREDFEAEIAELTVLVLAGDCELDDHETATLVHRVEQGLSVIALAECGRLDRLFGVRPVYPPQGRGLGSMSLGEGYLVTAGGHPVTGDHPQQLHFFGGQPVEVDGAVVLGGILDAHGRSTNRAGITLNRMGSGEAVFFAIDIAASVIRIQQGVYVDRDGIPAPDGSAPIDDGCLCADDGITLDWHFDRAPLADGQTPVFHQPVADMLKELLIRAILHSAHRVGALLPLVWYYPRNLTALGHLSLLASDSGSEEAQKMLHSLRMVGIRGTWFVRQPGYPLDVYRRLRNQDHEIGLAFSAGERGGWTEERFKVQLTQLLRATGGPEIVSNRTHLLRREGRNALFNWCEGLSVRAELTCGPSVPGCAGYLFGTSHPYYPANDNGTTYKCLAVPNLSQDPVSFLSTESCLKLIERSAAHYGIAAFSVQAATAGNPLLDDALRKMTALTRSRQMEWWKASDIASWERTRRKLRWELTQEEGCLSVGITAEDDIEGVTLLILTPVPAEIASGGRLAPMRCVNRYGFEFQSVVCTLTGRTPYRLSVQRQADAAA